MSDQVVAVDITGLRGPQFNPEAVVVRYLDGNGDEKEKRLPLTWDADAMVWRTKSHEDMVVESFRFD